MTEIEKKETTERVAFDPKKFHQQLVAARLHLHKNGAGQMLAYLKSRTAIEGVQLFNTLNERLKVKLDFSSEDALEELSKRNSAFHRELCKETQHCLAEILAEQEVSS